MKGPVPGNPQIRNINSQGYRRQSAEIEGADIEDADFGADFTENTRTGYSNVGRSAQRTLATPNLDATSLDKGVVDSEGAANQPREPSWRNSKWMPKVEDPTKQFWS